MKLTNENERTEINERKKRKETHLITEMPKSRDLRKEELYETNNENKRTNGNKRMKKKLTLNKTKNNEEPKCRRTGT